MRVTLVYNLLQRIYRVTTSYNCFIALSKVLRSVWRFTASCDARTQVVLGLQRPCSRSDALTFRAHIEPRALDALQRRGDRLVCVDGDLAGERRSKQAPDAWGSSRRYD
jgi:hypothetical protein